MIIIVRDTAVLTAGLFVMRRRLVNVSTIHNLYYKLKNNELNRRWPQKPIEIPTSVHKQTMNSLWLFAVKHLTAQMDPCLF